MEKPEKREVWQRGPVDGVPSLLQPVAHALLQAEEEVKELMSRFPAHLLWVKPSGLASAAFHLQHMSGVINRLYTYAKKESLSPEQLEWLAKEGKEEAGITVASLLETFSKTVQDAISQLKSTDPSTLSEWRGIGRAQIPTTLAGLLFHAAEHTMRHLGQLLVTVHVVEDSQG